MLRSCVHDWSGRAWCIHFRSRVARSNRTPAFSRQPQPEPARAASPAAAPAVRAAAARWAARRWAKPAPLQPPAAPAAVVAPAKRWAARQAQAAPRWPVALATLAQQARALAQQATPAAAAAI